MPACPPTTVSILQRADVAYPDAARDAHLEGTAIAKVELDASGKVTKVSIQKSAGAGVLDQAALKAARDSTYKPATEDCKPIASIYVMVVDLRP